ncbi:MAG TPA: response regulator transcription factor [Acidimicrobiales bacterium]|nr:response regulator transcription factor [Acidimicrobiales bacterium]
MRVLVAEDDPGLRSVLTRGLEENGYVVDAVANGADALAYLRGYEYAVAVVDWRMPRMSGVEAVEAARDAGVATPVLMLTARDTTGDRVEGLDRGADDYLVKPFDFAELLARLRALQRRPPDTSPPVLRCGDVLVDPATRQVQAGGHDVSLTATELAILELLVRRAPAAVPRRAIAMHAWPEEADALGSNTIEVHVARLRAKLSPASARIETVRSVGYRMVPA